MWKFGRKQTQDEPSDGIIWARNSGMYRDPVTAGVRHQSYQQSAQHATALVFAPSFGSTGHSWYVESDVLIDGNARSARPDWWRCDGCGHAVAWQKDGQPQLACPQCGAQLPTRYDK
jgi:hypothetical protein